MVKYQIIRYFIFFFILYCMTVPSYNLYLTIVSGISFILITALLYEEESPNIIYLGVVSQWIGATTRLIYGNFHEIPHSEILKNFYGAPENMETAFHISIIAVLIYAIGIKLTTRHTRIFNQQETLLKISTSHLLVLYLIFLVSYAALEYARNMLSGLSQLIIYAGYIKKGILFVLLYHAFYKKEFRWLIIGIFIVEFILSFFSYFSEFKELLFILTFVLLSQLREIKLKQMILGGAMMFLVISFGLIWGTVKAEYRERWMEGKIHNAQQAISNIVSIYKEADITEQKIGAERTVAGLGYLHFTSIVLSYVPEKEPHTNGSIWSDAVLHVLMPRMLFPDKKVLRDTEHLNKYTGLNINSSKVSYSMGYIAESYIDFGYLFMYIPVFLLGLLTGWVYSDIYKHTYNYFWGLLFIVPMYDCINVFGRNASKILGVIFLYYIAIILIRKFILPKLSYFTE